MEPHWLSDGGGGVGVYPTHDYESKKKIKSMKEKSYNLFGSTWIIQFVDEVVDENDKWLFGETESPSRVITISTKKPDGSKLSKDEIELTVLHEIVHSIFQTGQYMSCDNDEPLVEWTARCLKALKEQHII